MTNNLVKTIQERMKDDNLYTLVDENGNPVYTDDSMDGHFEKATCFEDMLTFSKEIGYSQMMALAAWSHANCYGNRIKVFPAKVKINFEIVGIDS